VAREDTPRWVTLRESRLAWSESAGNTTVQRRAGLPAERAEVRCANCDAFRTAEKSLRRKRRGPKQRLLNVAPQLGVRNERRDCARPARMFRQLIGAKDRGRGESTMLARQNLGARVRPRSVSWASSRSRAGIPRLPL
jgi:hypothetical protein